MENKWIKLNFFKKDEIATITIEDNGGGIPQNILPQIFDPYFTTKHKSQGTGLGLSICFRIITESIGGRIYAKNTQDGVVFTIELP